MTEKTISYPWGEVSVFDIAYAATVELYTDNQRSIVNIGQLTGNLALSQNSKELRAGAEMLVKVSADATNRTVSFGNGLTGKDVVVTANTEVTLLFWYDGSTFVLVSKNEIA